MRVLPPLADLRRMKRPDLVATLNACARHHREEIARIQAVNEAARSSDARTSLAQHRRDLGKVLLRAGLSRINVGGAL